MYDRLIFYDCVVRHLSDLRLHKPTWDFIRSLLHTTIVTLHIVEIFLFVLLLCCTRPCLLIVRLYPWVLHKNKFLHIKRRLKQPPLEEVKKNTGIEFTFLYIRWMSSLSSVSLLEIWPAYSSPSTL